MLDHFFLSSCVVLVKSKSNSFLFSYIDFYYSIDINHK